MLPCASAGNWKAAEVEVLNEFQFLTAKTVVYLVNMSEKDFIRQKNKWLAKIHSWVQENVTGPIIPYSAVFENKLAELPDEAAREKYIKVRIHPNAHACIYIYIHMQICVSNIFIN